MYFIKSPKKYYSLRSDCCSSLKDENDHCISIGLATATDTKGILRITLSLKNYPDYPHFFKLFEIDEKSKISKQESREIHHGVKSTDKEIELKFFGIKKAKKDEACNYIGKTFPQCEVNEIYKQNSSVFLLNIDFVNESGITISNLVQELQVGDQSTEALDIKAYAPKTLTDDEEITFVLTNNLKDENKSPTMQIESIDQKYVKQFQKIDMPARNVVVYQPCLKDINTNKFRCRLFNENNSSDWKEFTILRPIQDRLKRKSSSSEDGCSSVKHPRHLVTSTSCSSSSASSDNVENTNIKQAINDKLYAKLLGEIARTGFEYATTGNITSKQLKIIKKIPVVCILQDKSGNTPLHKAIQMNQETSANDLLDIIIKNFPDQINTINIDGQTPLILSVMSNFSPNFIKKILDSGADLWQKDVNGKSAFNLAIDYEKIEILNILFETAKNEKQPNEVIISLLKNIINREYYNGFSKFFDNFPLVISDDDMEKHLNEKEVQIYKSYFMKIFNSLLSIDIGTPVQEHGLDDIDLEDLLVKLD